MPARTYRRQGVPYGLVGLVSFFVFAFAMSPLGASAGPGLDRSAAAKAKLIKTGRALFTKHCVSCHGVNGKGGAGPKLHGIAASDSRITKIVENGKPGQMPAFGGKLKPGDVKAVIAYLRSLM